MPPSQINPEIPSALEQVVLWSLNKDPADRPADADQFIMALEQVRDALAAPAGEVTASMRALAAGSLIPAVGYPQTSVVPAADAAGAYGGAVGMAYNGDRLDRYDDDDRHDRRGLTDLAVDRGTAGAVADRRGRRRIPADAAQEDARALRRLPAAARRADAASRTRASRPT